MDIVKNNIDKVKGSSQFKLVLDKYKIVMASFDEVEKSIVKAIDHAIMPPKEKHVRRIILATHSKETNMRNLVFSLSKKIKKTGSWIVAIKALQLIHRLIQEGNERFANMVNQVGPGVVLNLSSFRDKSLKSGVYEQSEFVRQYARYLEQRLVSYKETSIRVLTPKYTLNNIYKVKDLFQMVESFHDLLRDFMSCQVTDTITTNSSTINAIGLLLVDSLSIYKILSDAVIKIIDLYFKMKQDAAKIAYDLYIKHIDISKKLIEYYETVKKCKRIISKRIPSLTPPPDTLLTSMKKYLDNPDSFKTVPKKEPENKEPEGDDDTDDEKSKKVEKKDDKKEGQLNFDDLLGGDSKQKEEKKKDEKSDLEKAFEKGDFEKAFDDEVSGDEEETEKTNEFFLPDDLFKNVGETQPSTTQTTNTVQQKNDDPFATDPFATNETNDKNKNNTNDILQPQNQKKIVYEKPKEEVKKDSNDPFEFLDGITEKEDVFDVKFDEKKDDKKGVHQNTQQQVNQNTQQQVNQNTQQQQNNSFDDDPFGVGGDKKKDDKKDSKVLNDFLFQ